MTRYESPRKPRRCPVCGSKRIASVLYGYPVFSEELEKKLEAGSVTLGGCIITGDDPVWECVDCHIQFYRK